MAEEKNPEGNGSVAAKNTIKKYTFSNNRWKSGNVPAGFEKARIQTFVKPDNISLAPIDRFYNHYNVTMPRVRVQFLTKRYYDTDSKVQKIWTDLNSGAAVDERGGGIDNLQNNFFVSMSIQDTGVKTLTLELYDRTFTTVQGYIYAAIKAANGIEGGSDKVTGKTSETVGGLTVEWAKMPSSIENNIRVDYGFEEDKDSVVPRKYWESMDLTNDFYQSDRNYRWVSRTSNQQISYGAGSDDDNSESKRNNITSDKVLGYYRNQSTVANGFEYFYIVNYTSTLTDTGVKYTITATGTENMKLSGYKLVQRYSKITGTPLNVTASFMSLFNGSKMVKLLWCDEYADFPIEEKKVLMIDGKYQAMDETQKKSKQESKTLDVSELGTLVDNLKKCLGSLDSEAGDSSSQKSVAGEFRNVSVEKLASWKELGSVVNVSDKEYQQLCWMIENGSGDKTIKSLGAAAYFLKKKYGKLKDASTLRLLRKEDGTWWTYSLSGYSGVLGSQLTGKLPQLSGGKYTYRGLDLSVASGIVDTRTDVAEYYTASSLSKKTGISAAFKAAAASMASMALSFDEEAMVSLAAEVFGGIQVDDEKKKLASAATASLNKIFGTNNRGLFASYKGVGGYLFELPVGILRLIAGDDFKLMWNAVGKGRGYPLKDQDSPEDNSYSQGAQFLLDHDGELDGFYDGSDFKAKLQAITGLKKVDATKEPLELLFQELRSTKTNGGSTIEGMKDGDRCDDDKRFSYSLIYAFACDPPSLSECRYYYFNEGGWGGPRKFFRADSLSDFIRCTIKCWTGKEKIEGSSLFNNVLLVEKSALSGSANAGELLRSFRTVDEQYVMGTGDFDDIAWIRKAKFKKADEDSYKTINDAKALRNFAVGDNEYSFLETDELEQKSAFEWVKSLADWSAGQGEAESRYDETAKSDFKNFKERCEFQARVAATERTPDAPSDLFGQLDALLEGCRDGLCKEKVFEGEILSKATRGGHTAPPRQDLWYLDDLWNVADSLDESKLQSLESELTQKISEYSGQYNQARDVLSALQQTKFASEVSINLGGPDSMSTKKTYYKNVSSLLNELCAQCPPWHDYEKEAEEKNRMMDGDEKATTYTDENGDEKSVDIKADCPTYRLSWELIGETADGVPVVGLSYQRPRKVRYVREYDWGNGNPKAHCIKSLQISTNSEFAMLSSAARNAAKLDDNGNVTIEKGKGNKLVDLTGFNSGSKNVTGFFRNVDNAENYNARTTSVYNAVNKGTITVLGDASLRFGGGIGPYTYPIFVNIKLQNEAAVWSSKTGEQELGTTSALSGIYTISSITHSITKDGYTTTMEIMRYPGIDDLVKVL